MIRSRTLSDQISNRLLLTVAITWVLVTSLVAAGIYNYFRTDRTYSQALEQASRLQGQVTHLNDAILSEVLSTRAFLISGEEESITTRDLAHREVQGDLDALKASLAAAPQVEMPDLPRLEGLHGEYDALAGELIALHRAGQTEGTAYLFDVRSDPLVQSILDTGQTLQGELQTWLTRANRDYSKNTSQSITLAAVALLAGMALSGLAILWLLTPLLRALGTLEQALVEAADTGSMQPIGPAASGNEPGSRVFQAYNTLAARFAELKAPRAHFMERLSHDMNSLLASILGYAGLVAESSLRSNTASLETYGKVIVKQTLRLGGMLGDATTITRISEKRLELLLTPIRLGALLQAVVAEAREESGREICYQDGAEACLVLGDTLRLREVFSKLLDNALKFSAPGTPVAVTVGRGEAGNEVAVRFEDHGIGIAPEDLPMLFRPFGRIRNTQTASIAGNGLSLYIAREIVEGHHGKLTVQFVPGRGTSFVVHLPLAEAGE